MKFRTEILNCKWKKKYKRYKKVMLDRSYQPHGNYDDIWRARLMYVTTQFPNCGKTVTDDVAQAGYYCPDKGYTITQ